jgi:sporulation protein YlmC with PRC-barrel domain
MQTCVTLIRLCALVGGLFLLGPARAPIPPDPPVTTPLVQLATSFEPTASSPYPPPVLAARALLGASVTSLDGTHLGWLDDLVIDPADAQITLVIVATGGWFGLGGRFVVLPWSMLRPAADGSTAVVTLEPERLQPPPRAKRYEKESPP